MKFQWHAIQRDGIELDESRGFGLSQEEREDCKIFSWICEETGKKISVILDTGEFLVDDQVLLPGRGDIEVLSGRTEPKYRLIYFKRHFFAYGERPGEDIVGLYGIGWQITEEGRNIKRILYIRPDGSIIFGGN